MTTANNPVVTAEMLREALGHVLDVLDGAGGFSDVPAVREAKRTYIMSRAMTQASPPPDAMVRRMTAWLYEREGGVAFELLAANYQEDWRKQARTALQSIGPMRGWEEVVTALRGIEDRVDNAINLYHDATRWGGEDAPDGEGGLRDWVFAEVRAALKSIGIEDQG